MTDHTLRVIAVGFPGMRRDSAPKHAVKCSCGYESKSWHQYESECPRFGDSQDRLKALVPDHAKVQS